jgi:hypothetical protein
MNEARRSCRERGGVVEKHCDPRRRLEKWVGNEVKASRDGSIGDVVELEDCQGMNEEASAEMARFDSRQIGWRLV